MKLNNKMRYVYLKKIDGELKKFIAYETSEFPYEKLKTIAIKSQKKKGEEIICDFGTFDIETTTIQEPIKIGFMYHWQMCIQGILVYGRYWEEWTNLLKKLAWELELNEKRKFVIYVHNLAYEFQFMRDFLKSDIGNFTGFYIDKRKPLLIRCENGLEFRCSWKLTNMSLEKACKFEKGVEIGKAAGDLDYRKIRTPYTILSDVEFGYCMADVVSLYQLVQNRMTNEHDNIESIPMTSTGYVRRDCRHATEREEGYRDLFQSLEINPQIYKMLKDAGRGGDTHANRYLSGKIIENVRGYDVQSSYPAMLKMRKFPMSKFAPYGDVESVEELERLTSSNACLFYIAFEKIELVSTTAMPYLSSDKALNLSKDVLLDNGRVMSAGIARYCITDIDWKIIKKQYKWCKLFVSDMYIAQYGYLPKSILGVVDKYFSLKTTLKGEISKAKVSGDKDVITDLNYRYMKSKNRLNAIFGMMYTDPIRTIITLEEDGNWKEENPNVEEALEKFYKSRNSFLYYAWGIWTTCHARFHLNRLVDCTGQDTTIYCDTDSSYGIDTVDVKNLVEIENRKIICEAEECMAYCDYDGVRYYMGVYEDQGFYERFKTLGAKKYVYEKKGEIHVTISGVNKDKGSAELGRIENFIPGFTFHDAGGLEMDYIDMPITDITVNGCTFKTASCIAQTDSTYEIGITGEYAEIIGYNFYEELEKSQLF